MTVKVVATVPAGAVGVGVGVLLPFALACSATALLAGICTVARPPATVTVVPVQPAAPRAPEITSSTPRRPGRW